ncbi:MAG: hypothetical protein V1493_02920 [Candidatus Diapherotrites archaeon]
MSQVSRALEKAKARYAGRVRAGEEAADVTWLFSQPKSRTLRASISQGMHVYALPLYGGKGMLEKWEVDSEGNLVRDAKGNPIFRHGPKQIAAMFLCSPQSKNMGSDELLVGKEDSMEGIRRTEALAILEKLGLKPEADAYVLFVRRPQEIGASVREFRERLEGILTHGKNWRPPYRLKLRMGERFARQQAGQIAAQTHPHLRTKAIADFFGPGFMKDPFLGSQARSVARRLKPRKPARKALKA